MWIDATSKNNVALIEKSNLLWHNSPKNSTNRIAAPAAIKSHGITLYYIIHVTK